MSWSWKISNGKRYKCRINTMALLAILILMIEYSRESYNIILLLKRYCILHKAHSTSLLYIQN